MPRSHSFLASEAVLPHQPQLRLGKRDADPLAVNAFRVSYVALTPTQSVKRTWLITQLVALVSLESNVGMMQAVDGGMRRRTTQTVDRVPRVIPRDYVTMQASGR